MWFKWRCDLTYCKVLVRCCQIFHYNVAIDLMKQVHITTFNPMCVQHAQHAHTLYLYLRNHKRGHFSNTLFTWNVFFFLSFIFEFTNETKIIKMNKNELRGKSFLFFSFPFMKKEIGATTLLRPNIYILSCKTTFWEENTRTKMYTFAHRMLLTLA